MTEDTRQSDYMERVLADCERIVCDPGIQIEWGSIHLFNGLKKHTMARRI